MGGRMCHTLAAPRRCWRLILNSTRITAMHGAMPATGVDTFMTRTGWANADRLFAAHSKSA